MKRKYLLATVIASLLLATGCKKDHIGAELVKGTTFYSAIPTSTKEVVFEYNSSVSSGTLLSTRESPHPIYGNLVGNTWRVSTCASVINANSDCSGMFLTPYTTSQYYQPRPYITRIDFGEGFNTENVTSMEYMFGDCYRLTSLDLSHFNTKNVINMVGMFSNCYDLKSLDLSHFNTENVTEMVFMFSDCRSLTSLDLSNFDMSSVTQKRYMCSNLSLNSKHCTITCTETVQTELQNGTDMPTPEDGVTFTWVRPTSK